MMLCFVLRIDCPKMLPLVRNVYSGGPVNEATEKGDTHG